MSTFYTPACEKTDSSFSQEKGRGRRTSLLDPPPPGKEGGLKGELVPGAELLLQDADPIRQRLAERGELCVFRLDALDARRAGLQVFPNLIGIVGLSAVAAQVSRERIRGFNSD